MSTLSPYGMFGFKVNRPLNDYEKAHNFNGKEVASTQVTYELSLTLMNNTFLEGVDVHLRGRSCAVA